MRGYTVSVALAVVRLWENGQVSREAEAGFPEARTPAEFGARAAPDRADGPWIGVILATAGDPRLTRQKVCGLQALRSGSSNNINNRSVCLPVGQI